MTSSSGSVPRKRRSQGWVLVPSGSSSMAMLAVSGISACTAPKSPSPMAFVVDTTISPAFSSRCATSPNRRTSSAWVASTHTRS